MMALRIMIPNGIRPCVPASLLIHYTSRLLSAPPFAPAALCTSSVPQGHFIQSCSDVSDNLTARTSIRPIESTWATPRSVISCQCLLHQFLEPPGQLSRNHPPPFWILVCEHLPCAGRFVYWLGLKSGYHSVNSIRCGMSKASAQAKQGGRWGFEVWGDLKS